MSNGKITGFHVGWRPDRPFPIDMYETLIPPAFGSLEGTDRGKAPTNPLPSPHARHGGSEHTHQCPVEVGTLTFMEFMLTPAIPMTHTIRTKGILCDKRPRVDKSTRFEVFRQSGTRLS